MDGITDPMDVSLSKLRDWLWTGGPGVLRSVGSQRVGHNSVTGRQACFHHLALVKMLLWMWVCMPVPPLFHVFGGQNLACNRWGGRSFCVSHFIYLAAPGLTCGRRTLGHSVWALAP